MKIMFSTKWIKPVKQFFCKHEWEDGNMVDEALLLNRKYLLKCAKCGKTKWSE